MDGSRYSHRSSILSPDFPWCNHQLSRSRPCSPSLQARFNISVGVAPGVRTVLSNMPEILPAVWSSPDMVVHTFQTTSVMSTYLVALVMGNLERKEVNCTVDGGPASSPDGKSTDQGDGVTLVRVWSTARNIGQLQTALDVACSALKTYSESFGVPYVLPKLDLVGIPAFSAGAMENWGLITFKCGWFIAFIRSGHQGGRHPFYIFFQMTGPYWNPCPLLETVPLVPSLRLFPLVVAPLPGSHRCLSTPPKMTSSNSCGSRQPYAMRSCTSGSETS